MGSQEASVMISPNDLISKAEEILALAKSYDGDRTKQLAIRNQLEGLSSELESPEDMVDKQVKTVFLRTAIDLMIKLRGFDKMPREGSITATELRALMNMDPDVIASTWKAASALPDYFSTHSASDLYDLHRSSFACTYDSEGLTFYETMSKKPELLNTFNKAMSQRQDIIPILGMYPFASLKTQVEAEPDRAFIVDIGGGKGHCLQAIGKETENVFGTKSKMILQNRPDVIDSISVDQLPPNAEKMAHDFCTPQPVKNAHLYYLRRILHNYQDDRVLEILRALVTAMTPPSRLLITEVVIPPAATLGENPMFYRMDMYMMVIGGRERTVKHFENLFEQVGLVLKKVWRYKGEESSPHVVLEAALMEGEGK